MINEINEKLLAIAEPGEIFKPLGGGYFVSSFGRVATFRVWGSKVRRVSYLGEPRVLSPFVFEGALSIRVHGKTKKMSRLSRLVLDTFDPVTNPEEYFVKHKDENPRNCKLENLYRIKRADLLKSLHETRRIPRGNKHPKSKLNEEKVREIRRLYDAGGVIYNDLAARFGVSRSTIRKVITRQTWTDVK